MKKATVITGNTFQFKEELKALSAKWQPERKAWVVQDLTMRKKAELSALIHRLRQAGCTITYE